MKINLMRLFITLLKDDRGQDLIAASKLADRGDIAPGLQPADRGEEVEVGLRHMRQLLPEGAHAIELRLLAGGKHGL